MIALITSTIHPTNAHSIYSPAERFTQTINTINKLVEAGFKDIYLLDNSIQPINTTELYNAYDKIKIFQSPQFTFEYKGMNEALLILNNIHHLPPDVPILKISGRYYPSPTFSINAFNDYPGKDFIGKGYNFNKRMPGFSTKAYFVKNVTLLTEILVLSVEEMGSYSKGIHGLESLIQAIKQAVKPQLGISYQLSMEQSFARIIKAKYNYQLLDKMHIEGFEATAEEKRTFAE
jgi:hypothetical protein